MKSNNETNIQMENKIQSTQSQQNESVVNNENDNNKSNLSEINDVNVNTSNVSKVKLDNQFLKDIESSNLYRYYSLFEINPKFQIYETKAKIKTNEYRPNFQNIDNEIQKIGEMQIALQNLRLQLQPKENEIKVRIFLFNI